MSPRNCSGRRSRSRLLEQFRSRGTENVVELMGSSAIRPKSGHEPTRQCVVTRLRAPQYALLRLVLGPEGRPHVDLLGRAPGRGVYVQACEKTLVNAVTRRGVGRAFKGRAQPLSSDEAKQLVAHTVQRLTSRILDLIGVARRAGALDIGMDAVCDSIQRGQDGLVIITTEDLGPSSNRKIGEALHRSSADIKRFRVGTKIDLGSLLGRGDVGIVAVRPSHHAERLVREAERRLGILGSTIGAELASSNKSEVK